MVEKQKDSTVRSYQKSIFDQQLFNPNTANVGGMVVFW